MSKQRILLFALPFLLFMGGPSAWSGQIGFSNYWTEVDGLPAPRRVMAATVFSNALYVIGGISGSNLPYTEHTNVYRFDGSFWTEVAGLPVARHAHACGVLSNALYSIAGSTNATTLSTNVYRYDGMNWIEVAGLPAARTLLAAGVQNGALYGIGGDDGSTGQTNVFKYDGTTWTEVAVLPEPREYFSAENFNGELYAIGGRPKGTAVSTTNVYRYDGTTWTEVAGLPAQRTGLGSSVLNNRLYALSGFFHDGVHVYGCTNVYRYDGTNWTEIIGLPTTTNRSTTAAGTLQSVLYVVGGYDGESGGSLTNVYRYTGVLSSGVTPSSGNMTGGTEVAISGVGLCNGTTTDVSLVTLCGATAVVESAAGSTQIVVRTGHGLVFGTGDVVVISAARGTSTAVNVFNYTGANMDVLGTNGAIIVNNEVASVAKGTDFGSSMLGSVPVTHTFAMTNNGDQMLTISGVTTNGSSLFQCASIPAVVSAGACSNFMIAFNPSAVGTHTAAVSIASDGTNTPYVMNLLGVVTKQTQTITFPMIADQIITITVRLSATASSGLPVNFVVGAGPGTISSGSNLTLSATGIVSIVASQAGDINWNAAPNVTNSFTVTGISTSSTAVSSGVCADYDGDGLADPAVYDEATGTWKVKLSSAGYYLFATTLNGLGGGGWASVSADYDGDSLADPAVYQELTGTWKVLLSSANYVLLELPQFLGGIGYSAMPADYDADRLADPGIYQREMGDWKVMLSSANYFTVERLGLLGGTGYRAVAADYDGDMKGDPAIYGESNGVWAFKLSSAGYVTFAMTQTLGGTDYIPVPADYDGDGLADPAVISTTGNEWIAMLSSAGYIPVHVTLQFE